MMIMKLQIKLLPNLVGQPEYGPHQSGTEILSGSHVTRPWRTYKLWGSDDEPIFRKMAWGHEIWDGIHIWEQSVGLVDLPDDRQAIENKWIFRKMTDADVMFLSTKLNLLRKVFDKIKVLTTMRFSHSYRCLKVCLNHVSSCRILWNVENGCQNCIP